MNFLKFHLRTLSDGLEEGFELGLLLGCKLTEGCKRVMRLSVVRYEYIKRRDKMAILLTHLIRRLEEGFELGLLLGCKLTEGCKRSNDVNKVV